MKDYDVSMEDLSYELEITLKAMFHFAGVKDDKLEKACDIYVENIDDVLADSNAEGVDEIIEMVEYMRKNHKELFA